MGCLDAITLDNVSNTYNKLLNRINNLKSEEQGPLNMEIISSYQEKFKSALGKDLNTSLAITILYDVLKEDMNAASKLYLIKDFDRVLSLNLLEEKQIDEKLKTYIEEKIQERNEAKKQKDYAKADEIRSMLEKEGIYIEDTREGTIFEIR